MGVPGAAEELEFGGFIGLVAGGHLLGRFRGRGGGRVEGEVALGAAGEEGDGEEEERLGFGHYFDFSWLARAAARRRLVSALGWRPSWLVGVFLP